MLGESLFIDVIDSKKIPIDLTTFCYTLFPSPRQRRGEKGMFEQEYRKVFIEVQLFNYITRL